MAGGGTKAAGGDGIRNARTGAQPGFPKEHDWLAHRVGWLGQRDRHQLPGRPYGREFASVWWADSRVRLRAGAASKRWGFDDGIRKALVGIAIEGFKRKVHRKAEKDGKPNQPEGGGTPPFSRNTPQEGVPLCRSILRVRRAHVHGNSRRIARGQLAQRDPGSFCPEDRSRVRPFERSGVHGRCSHDGAGFLLAVGVAGMPARAGGRTPNALFSCCAVPPEVPESHPAWCRLPGWVTGKSFKGSGVWAFTTFGFRGIATPRGMPGGDTHWSTTAHGSSWIGPLGAPRQGSWTVRAAASDLVDHRAGHWQARFVPHRGCATLPWHLARR